MNQLLAIAIALALSFSVRAFAAAEEPKKDGETTLKIEDVNGRKNKVAGDIDEEISNAKLRAESGSKSKYSLSATANYNGGAVSSPFAADRPNLAKVPGVQTQSSISGALNARYRADKNNSFTAGTTYGVMTPFQGDVTKGRKQTNVFDPAVGYSHIAKIGAFQTVGVLAYAYGTSNESTAIDLTHQVGASFNAMHAFGNGLSAGASVGADYNVYTSKPGTVKDVAIGSYGKDARVAWDFAIYPQAEYKFNDTFSARTVFGYFNWKHLYGDTNKTRLLQKFVYQSIGVGISVARDVFLYPNIQFVPDNIRSDFTNFAMSCTFNVF